MRAAEYFERVLDVEPRNAKAYFGKMLVRLKLRKEEELNTYIGSVLDNNQNFQKAVRFADDEYKKSVGNTPAESSEQHMGNRI